ncbi:Ribonuclease 3 [Allorhodopirellula solitaria]|uniref:Ribonuclease 3 n=1 Tax=Allorhodopirellula solitaria TaxID=2527987 RepID=A0A5C5Y010_9BACT|nr:Ribonuclease 3 [Allorhodopirellula solitaria]
MANEGGFVYVGATSLSHSPAAENHHSAAGAGLKPRRILFDLSLLKNGFALPASPSEPESADDLRDSKQLASSSPDDVRRESAASQASVDDQQSTKVRQTAPGRRSDEYEDSDEHRAGPGPFIADQRVAHPGSIHLVDAAAVDQPYADSDAKLQRCQEILEYRFKDIALLRSALTHASGAANRLSSNERLEFLGDAVLGMTVCQWLFEAYPEYNEGDLTKIKSAVVSRRTCGRTATKLGLDECLIVGRGVTRNRSYPRSLVSDVFESIIAALYLDGGNDVVRDRLRKWLADEVRLSVDTQGSGNHKSVLQQYSQRELSATPVYKLIREMGPDHRKAFLIGAVIGPQAFPAAWGNNKKDAEQRAAANALAELHHLPIPHLCDSVEEPTKSSD